MSGALLLIGEIVVFMVLATIIGFALGRLTRRSRPGVNVAELTAVRERTSLLEREVDELTAALTEARMKSRGEDDEELQGRVAMAEREAEGLERRLQEAAGRIEELERERDEWIELAEQNLAANETADGAVSPPTDSDSDAEPISADELDALRAELSKRTQQIAKLERVAADARRLEAELQARNSRIGDLEAALEANAAARAAVEGDAASIGMSIGAGSYADSRLEFDPTDGS